MTVIEVSALFGAAPDRDRFVCLDGIHMTEPYHRLMAGSGSRSSSARAPRRLRLMEIRSSTPKLELGRAAAARAAA
jgi:hypothetical protein